MNRPRSLILITVDCLRADHVGFMGYARPTTPFLDSLAADSVVLNNATVAGTPTYYSFPGIMASRYPLALGRDVIGVAPDEPTLASILRQSGFSTAAFVAGNPYLTRQLGYAEGFDVFHDFLDHAGHGDEPERISESARSRFNSLLRSTSKKLGMRSLYDRFYFNYGQRVAARSPKSLDQLRRFPSANVIVDQASEWLKHLDGNEFFLWLHLMDPHAPYYPPHAALELMGNEAMTASRARFLNSYWNQDLSPTHLQRYRKEMIALYDSGIRWVDQQIAGLVGVLRDLRLWNDCAFVLTADHGEEFLEHGGRMHAPSKVTEELVHVPLIMHWPGISPQKVDAPFSLLSLAPTLLDCMQVPVPADFRGRSYWSQIKANQSWDGEAIVECIQGCSNPLRKTDRQNLRLLTVRETRFKLVLNFGSGPGQLFDLHADPGELHPLPIEEAKAVRRRLLERAHKHIAESLRGRDTGTRAALVLRDIAVECKKA
jgi:arylsulfatase A-like enzyme